MPSLAPTRLARVRVALYHCARILFLPWPKYTLSDLAAVQDCLDGPAFERAAEKLRQDPDGRRLLEERPDMGMLTVDWQALSLMPVDSMGYNFWHHFYVNGLLRVVHLGLSILPWSEEAELAKSRYRVTHDLRHVLLGLGVETYEEVVLQAFQCAQLFQKLSALIIVFGTLKHTLIDGQGRHIFSLAPKAWAVGRGARFLLCMPCEALWETPLEEVRRAYGVTPVGARYPVTERHPDAGQVFDLAG